MTKLPGFGFGYQSDSGCDICKQKPAEVEPRFGYTTCERHSILPPVTFGKVRDGLMKDSTKSKKND